MNIEKDNNKENIEIGIKEDFNQKQSNSSYCKWWTRKRIIAFFLFPIISVVIGFIPGFMIRTEIDNWYSGLNPSPLKPPNWLFAPVWSILYISMGFSGFLIYSIEQGFEKEHKWGWIFYFAQSVLNYIWTPIFFNAHQMLIAGIEIIILWLCLVTTVILFSKIRLSAGLVLIPYTIWITFATLLNWTYWDRNRNY